MQRGERCAGAARRLGLRPAGSAGSYDGFLLVEVPLPWPREAGDHPDLVALRQALGALRGRWRVQAVVGRQQVGGDLRRVVAYAADRGGAPRYERREARVGLDRLRHEPADVLGEVAAGPALDDGLVDLLVCTHGTRDACCGTDGTRLHTELVAADLPGVRLWRTSHLGGHRYAPTALSLPDGHAWAFLDAPTAVRVATRTGPTADLAAHDRGCAALPDPWAQAADSAVLAREGWAWLGTPRSTRVVELEDRRAVRIDVADGSAAYLVDVAASRAVPVPSCRAPEGAEPPEPVVELTAGQVQWYKPVIQTKH